MPEEQPTATSLYVIPILASLLVGILCAFLFLRSGVEVPPLPLQPETGYGPLLNAAFFVMATGLAATMIYLLLKYGIHRLIRVLMGTAFAVLSASLVLLYSELALAIVGIDAPLALIVLSAVGIAALVVVEVFRVRGRVSGLIVLTLGGATGALLGAFIPLLTAVLMLLLLALYDVIAVYRGPVGKIAAVGLEYLPGASLSFMNVNVGLGDLTFYSMLVSRMLLSFGWVACFAGMLGVLVGAFLSFKMVEKKGIFPGLPFSVALGLSAAVITTIV